MPAAPPTGLAARLRRFGPAGATENARSAMAEHQRAAEAVEALLRRIESGPARSRTAA